MRISILLGAAALAIACTASAQVAYGPVTNGVVTGNPVVPYCGPAPCAVVAPAPAVQATPPTVPNYAPQVQADPIGAYQRAQNLQAQTDLMNAQTQLLRSMTQPSQ
ncbi:hypothetical protein [Burkholderia vietnamiensis]|uniref:hypothetical protein n=1 Tax=Burkholderia vietnamiensis TaxID=60552 RepID=UPI00352FB1FC